MEIIESKTGNGAFSVARDGAKVIVTIADSPARTFMSVQHAYDWCRDSYADLQGTMRGYSYLNAAYALEDMPQPLGDILGADENVGACDA